MFFFAPFPYFYLSRNFHGKRNLSVVSIKRTGSHNYFEVFYYPELFFSCTKWNFFTTLIFFFHVLNEIFAPPCSLITSCSLNRYYRVSTLYRSIREIREDTYPGKYEKIWFFISATLSTSQPRSSFESWGTLVGPTT